MTVFKVSLLPAAYRKRLEEKKKKDLLARVALIVLMCLAIVYAGIFVQGQIMNSKLKKLERQNAELQQSVAGLEQLNAQYGEQMRGGASGMYPSEQSTDEVLPDVPGGAV